MSQHMASFSNDYYSTGGMNFETGYSQQYRETRGPQSVYDAPRGRAPQPQYAAPPRPSYSTYSDGFDDELGNYVPGSTVASARSPYADSVQQKGYSSQNSFDDGFDDGFDDDFDTPAAPPAHQQYRRPEPHGRSSAPSGRKSRYDVYNDYGSDEFEAEYGGLPTIGARRRPNQPQPAQQSRSNVRQGFDRETAPVVSDDGYYSEPTIVDTPFNAQVPSIFSGYFDEQYMAAAQQNSRNSKNKVSSYQQRRKMRMMTSILSVAAVAVLALSLSLYFTIFHVSDPLNVKTAFSDMTADTSQSLIKQSVDSTLSQQSIIVSVNGRTGSFQLSSYGFEYATDPDAKDEYIEVTDEDGNVSTQTITTLGSLTFNETLVREFLYGVVGSEGIRMAEPSFEVDYDASVMTVKAGTNGYGIDYDVFMQQVTDRIASGNFSSTIECTMAETVAPAVNIDEIYEQVHCLVSDATKSYDGSGQVVYTPDVIGVDFDINTARSQIAAGGNEWNISLVLTQPSMTLVELKAPDCPDLLATYTSYFNGDNKARSNNLALAARYIMESGYLEPGDELSFNDTVGERTPERGFNKATVYSSEGTDEDYGGGICQTSSVLYYTCILANLEIVERHNHLYTVAYMTDTKGVQKFGNDATVNWGTLDLKIKNNREYPIRIEFVCSSGKITCNIYGTWNGITADFGYVERETQNYKVIYRPAQPGKSSQAGQLGRTVQTYRIVYQDGVEIDRYREDLSTYIPLNEVRYTDNLPAGREYYVEY